VGFVADKVALGQVFLRVFQFSPANISPPLLHIHLSPPHEMCDSSDQAAQYHHLGPKLGASFLTRHFGWKQNKKVKNVLSSALARVCKGALSLSLLKPVIKQKRNSDRFSLLRAVQIYEAYMLVLGLKHQI
jgi:hypothetical protein